MRTLAGETIEVNALAMLDALPERVIGTASRISS